MAHEKGMRYRAIWDQMIFLTAAVRSHSSKMVITTHTAPVEKIKTKIRRSNLRVF